MVGDMAGCATEDEFAEARMAICPHHEQITAQRFGLRADRFADAAVCGGLVDQRGRHVVALQGGDEALGAQQLALIGFLVIDHQDRVADGTIEKRQGIEPGPRGFARPVPGNDGVLRRGIEGPLIGDHQHRAPAFDGEALGELQNRGHLPVDVSDGGHDQIGAAAVLHQVLGKVGAGGPLADPGGAIGDVGGHLAEGLFDGGFLTALRLRDGRDHVFTIGDDHRRQWRQSGIDMQADDVGARTGRNGFGESRQATCPAAVVEMDEQRTYCHVLAMFCSLVIDRRTHEWHLTLTAVKAAAILVADTGSTQVTIIKGSAFQMSAQTKIGNVQADQPRDAFRHTTGPRVLLRRALKGALAAGLSGILLASAGGANLAHAEEAKPGTPTWQSVLALQLNDEYRCVLDKILFDRDIEAGGKVSKEGRARCLDGREFDFSRPSTHEKFDIRLCLPTVC